MASQPPAEHSDSADPTEPADIRYDNARGRLEITWADGAETAYGYEFLRWHCPCATCAGEMGQPGQLQFVAELRPEQYQLESIQLVGLYAIRPTWADGHDSGIFAFDRLRALGAEAAEDLRRHRAGQHAGQHAGQRAGEPDQGWGRNPAGGTGAAR